MTETEKNLKDLEDTYKMGGIEKAAYESQKKQLEEERASGNGQAGGQVSSESLPEDNLAPAPPEIPKIHVSVGGKKIGAFEREEVIKKIRAGEIGRDARVWKDGMPDWIEAGELPELEDYFGPPPDTPAENKRREEEEAARRKAEHEAALRRAQQEADARAAQERAAAEARARAEAEARTRAAQKAAEEEAEARRRAQYTPVPPTPQYNRPSPSYSGYNHRYSNKNRGVLIVLSILFGWIGADRFYAGRTGLGIVKIISMVVGVRLIWWIGIIWWVIDIFLAIVGKQKDRNGYYITSFKKFFLAMIKTLVKLVIILGILGGVLFFVGKSFFPNIFNLLGISTVSQIALANDNATVTSNVNFRKGHSTDDEIIRQLQRGDTVTLTGETSDGWTQITHNGDTGWVSSEYINVGKSFFSNIFNLFGKSAVNQTTNANTGGNVTATATITSNVNFRTGHSTDDEIIRQLQQGDTVTLTGETSDGWTQITHNGNTGWVSSDFINISEVVE